MNPLCVTVKPALPMPIGDENLERFINSGCDHIRIIPNAEVMQTHDRNGFIELGFPYYGWLLSIQSAVFRVVNQFEIGSIFYGEDREVEYASTAATKQQPFYDINYVCEIHLEEG
jgi:hypothetical protein